MNIRQNNLGRSQSPYLLQHVSNPVWWQEWSCALLDEAAAQNKLLFVSVGYATCHWCHVMASEAFSDPETAGFLNDNFICVKVDREQRPDIDQYLMSFITATTGGGGWPLNVFITHDLRPVFALTYAPVSPRRGMRSFIDIARRVLEYHQKKPAAITPFHALETGAPVSEEESLVENLVAYFDKEYGGFGTGQKFPPHTTLLYLLYYLCVNDSPDVRAVCELTLDAILRRGLTDHLQGGVFRYCVDRRWTIPHFEKMLYDQSMALWCFSLASAVLRYGRYRTMAVNIVRCLRDCFDHNGLYISAFDADTAHREGRTYLWDFEELRSSLSPDEFIRFTETYIIDTSGNFEGLNHLIRKNDTDLASIEKKLLLVRSKRAQPDRDGKILCGLNALTAIAYIQAGRNLDMPDLNVHAAGIVRQLQTIFWDGKRLGHSIFNGVVQQQSFLFDIAAMVTAVSMLYEDDPSWLSPMIELTDYIKTFRDDDNAWLESRPTDFKPIYASSFDHPMPSSVSLAEMALTRVSLLTGETVLFRPYRESFQSDFYNIHVMMSCGLFHIVSSKIGLVWKTLPPNTLQIRGEKQTDCYKGQCTILH